MCSSFTLIAFHEISEKSIYPLSFKQDRYKEDYYRRFFYSKSKYLKDVKLSEILNIIHIYDSN